MLFAQARVAMSLAIALLAGSAPVWGQVNAIDTEPKREVTVLPRLSVTETWTDNVGALSTGKKADQVTDISPGIHIAREGRRLKGYLDYARHSLAYAQNTSPTRSQNELNMAGLMEAVDSWMYVDLSGVVSQQSISAFGTQSSQNTSLNTNKTEVSSYRISPFVRGRMGSAANYEARFSRAVTLADSAAASNVAESDGMLAVNGDSAFRNLGWTANASRQNIDYSAGRPTEVDRLDLGLSYALTSQLVVSANGGRENSNLTTRDKQAYATSALGVDWSPSERSKVSASGGRRSFGETHHLSIEHRTARTAWKYSDTRDIAATPIQAVLTWNHADSPTPVVSGFLPSAVTLQRRHDLSVSLLGKRDTVTFVATESESHRVDTLSTALDDLAVSGVNQQGFSIAWVHRVTSDYALTSIVAQQKTRGALNSDDSRLQEMGVSLTGKVGPSASASAGIRRVVFSGLSPYEESAFTINLNAYF